MPDLYEPWQYARFTHIGQAGNIRVRAGARARRRVEPRRVREDGSGGFKQAEAAKTLSGPASPALRSAAMSIPDSHGRPPARRAPSSRRAHHRHGRRDAPGARRVPPAHGPRRPHPLPSLPRRAGDALPPRRAARVAGCPAGRGSVDVDRAHPATDPIGT